ncbi:chemerin-like receptor 1 [Pyxicephalus adspersus]|uniref:chemerin-like receptor 1 n=1 Tax=Pyxicephalus adspersus TaxID=30357 RepID=UPI003B598CA5
MENTTAPDTIHIEEVSLYFILYVYLMVAFSVIAVLGTLGNGVVIWFTSFKMKKTVNGIWFLSLAIADFTFSLFLPLRIIQLAHFYTWMFGTFMCKFHIFVIFLNLFASILHLAVISIDRCISVFFPIWCQNHRTTRLALKVCVVVWILAIAFSVPSFLFTENASFGDYEDCVEDQFSESGQIIQSHQVIIRFIIFFVIPFTIIVTCYTLIFLRMRKNQMTNSTKPFKVLLAVIISFFTCWFPYHVVWLITVSPIMYSGYIGRSFEVAFDVATSLAYANSCVNPVLYVFIGHDFKKKTWHSIKPTLERAFNDESRLIESQRTEDRCEDNDITSQL